MHFVPAFKNDDVEQKQKINVADTVWNQSECFQLN